MAFGITFVEMSLNYIDQTGISFAAEVIQMFPSLLLKLGLLCFFFSFLNSEPAGANAPLLKVKGWSLWTLLTRRVSLGTRRCDPILAGGKLALAGGKSIQPKSEL